MASSGIERPCALMITISVPDAIGVAIPYTASTTLLANRGSVFVGVSHDTAAFAAHSIAGWWKRDGADRYRRGRQLLILADTGGSNSCRTGAWKTELQAQLCNSFGLTVTVAHYPHRAPPNGIPSSTAYFPKSPKTGPPSSLSTVTPKSSTSSATHAPEPGLPVSSLPRPEGSVSNRHLTRSRAHPPSLSQTTFDFARLELYACSNVNLLLRQP